MPCPHVAGDGSGQKADRACAGDDHVFADEIIGQSGMSRIAKGIEDRGGRIRNRVWDDNGVFCGNGDIFRETAGAGRANGFVDAAKVGIAGAAGAAMTAGDMPFAGNTVAQLKALDVLADLHNFTDEFMTDDQWKMNTALRPSVPLIIMIVRAANGRFFDFDQDVVMTD